MCGEVVVAVAGESECEVVVAVAGESECEVVVAVAGVSECDVIAVAADILRKIYRDCVKNTPGTAHKALILHQIRYQLA